VVARDAWNADEAFLPGPDSWILVNAMMMRHEAMMSPDDDEAMMSHVERGVAPSGATWQGTGIIVDLMEALNGLTEMARLHGFDGSFVESYVESYDPVEASYEAFMSGDLAIMNSGQRDAYEAMMEDDVPSFKRNQLR